MPEETQRKTIVAEFDLNAFMGRFGERYVFTSEAEYDHGGDAELVMDRVRHGVGDLTGLLDKLGVPVECFHGAVEKLLAAYPEGTDLSREFGVTDFGVVDFILGKVLKERLAALGNGVLGNLSEFLNAFGCDGSANNVYVHALRHILPALEVLNPADRIPAMDLLRKYDLVHHDVPEGIPEELAHLLREMGKVARGHDEGYWSRVKVALTQLGNEDAELQEYITGALDADEVEEE